MIMSRLTVVLYGINVVLKVWNINNKDKYVIFK